MTDMTAKIDRLKLLNIQMEELKKSKDELEADIIKQCSTDLENTKYKSIHYYGTDAELTAVNADTLKITYPSFLPFIFNKEYSDVVKEDKKYKLSASATRMIIGLWKGNYLKDTTVLDVISQMPITEAESEQLIRKCKGINYEKDVKSIRNYTKLSETEAQEYAYLIAEAAVWQEFKALLTLNGITSNEQVNDILDKIKAAFVVEETTKISLN